MQAHVLKLFPKMEGTHLIHKTEILRSERRQFMCVDVETHTNLFLLKFDVYNPPREREILPERVMYSGMTHTSSWSVLRPRRFCL
jgi:hypothetical protein